MIFDLEMKIPTPKKSILAAANRSETKNVLVLQN